LGTALSDSSLAVMTTGSTMNASVNQPASSDTFQSRKITNMPKPKRPNTIEGTPARFRIASRMKRMNGRRRVFTEVNGARHAERERNRHRPTTSSTVPTMQGKMPPAE
jgi:hypothetical protein